MDNAGASTAESCRSARQEVGPLDDWVGGFDQDGASPSWFDDGRLRGRAYSGEKGWLGNGSGRDGPVFLTRWKISGGATNGPGAEPIIGSYRWSNSGWG